MKIVILLICVALAGCGAKSKEDIAKDLITEKLKTTLPDFNQYESLNFGTMGTASLTYEETDQYKNNLKSLNQCKDSVTLLEKLIKENSTPALTVNYQQLLKQLQDSTIARNERNKNAKQSYTPEKLFKLSHAYLLKAASGPDVKKEEYFFIDEGLKKVIKVQKAY
jgi:hypothetical protein